MNIYGISQNNSSIINPAMKISRRNDTTTNEEEEKKNSLAILNQKDNSQKGSNLVDMLKERKEMLQKRLTSMQKRLASIDDLKNQLPCEEKIVNKDGKTFIKKIYTEDDQKILDSLKNEETSILGRVKSLGEELFGMDDEIAAAVAQEQSRQLERQKEQQDKRKEKIEDNKLRTEEEQEQRAQMKQAEFFIQSDSIKEYVQSSKAVKARLAQEETFAKIEMSKDSYNSKALEQRHLHGKDPIKYSPVANTSLNEERARIDEGNFAPSEREKGSKIKDLQKKIANIQDNIDSKLSEANGLVEEEKENKENLSLETPSGEATSNEATSNEDTVTINIQEE